MSKTILGVDLGKARIGLAVGDEKLKTSLPLKVIRRSGDKADIETIASVAAEYESDTLVLGFPLNIDGSESPGCDAARRFAERLKERGFTVHLEDERLTTVEAKDLMREAGVSAKKSRGRLDMFAAAAILRSFFARFPQ